MDKEILERLCIVEDKILIEKNCRASLEQELEELVNYINLKLPALHFSIDGIKWELDDMHEKIDNLTKSST
jgi:hypothetical protein